MFKARTTPVAFNLVIIGRRVKNMKAKRLVAITLALALFLAMYGLYENFGVKRTTQASKTGNTNIAEIQKNKAIVFRIDKKYMLKEGNEIKYLIEKVELENTRSDQFYKMEDSKRLIYNTDAPGVEGRIILYDTELDKKIDILEKLNIHMDGYISVFAYKDNKIIAVIGRSEKDKKTGAIISKVDTNKMLEIDLMDESHRFIDLPFTPYGISSYQGLGFYGNGYFLCQSGYQSSKNLNQSVVIVDRSGKVDQEITLYDEKVIYSIKASPSGKFISYQTGQTPTDLYIYDVGKNEKINIYNSMEEKAGFCIYHSWSDSGRELYYILQVEELDKNNTLTTNYYIKSLNVDSMKEENTMQIQIEDRK